MRSRSGRALTSAKLLDQQANQAHVLAASANLAKLMGQQANQAHALATGANLAKIFEETANQAQPPYGIGVQALKKVSPKATKDEHPEGEEPGEADSKQ